LKTEENLWIKEFPAAIVVCDPDGIVIEMNDKAAKAFAKDGGHALIGRNMSECHPASCRVKLERLMESRQPNVYTIERNGIKKLIYQSPWFLKGEYAGFVQISMEVPFDIPHFVRS
jgi:PAS domain-containing protein